MRKQKNRLLIDYLEGISRRILEEYPEEVRGLMGRRTGIYALYKQDQLYYVGLASNLRGRITTHLKDRHKGLWDRFNVYLTPNNDHMKDLESLVLRISRPKGNRVKGKLQGANNLYRTLAKAMTETDADRRAGLIGGHVARRRRQLKSSRKSGTHALAGSIDRRIALRGTLKGHTYRASLRKNGLVSFRNKLYKSPSSAASAITKRTMNGWWFWKYKDGRKWVELDKLRK